MQRLPALPIVFALFLALGPAARGDDAQAKPAEKMNLNGAWRMVSLQPAGSDEYVKLPEGQQHVKLVAGGRFVWTLAKDGKISRSAGGKCAFHGDEYTEQIEFVSDDGDVWLVGKTGVFKSMLKGGKWYVDGVIKTENGESRIKEIWERVK